VAAIGIQHVDLAVGDVERSLSFYLAVLGPLGLTERHRLTTYRGTEEVVYLEFGTGQSALGLRPADDGEYRYHEVGVEHLAFQVERRDEVDEAYGRCRATGAGIQSPPERHYVEDEDYYAFFAFDPDGIRIEVFSWQRNDRAPSETGVDRTSKKG